MAWIRRRSWSSSDEHFIYDARSGRFVSDPRDWNHRTLPKSITEVGPATYVEALAEVRREVEREPASEWESGHLIRLYAEVMSAGVVGVWRDQGRAFDPSLRPVLREIVTVAQAVLTRTHPAEVVQLLELSEEQQGFRGLDNPPEPDLALRMNAVAARLTPIDGAATRAVWLASFSQPALSTSSTDMELGVQGNHTSLEEFVSACADLSRGILASAGPTTLALTTGLRVGQESDDLS